MIRINILFIVNALHFGGAEKHVVSLLNNLDQKKFKLFLACLKEDNALLPQIKAEKVTDIFCCQVNKKIDWRAVQLIANYIEDHSIDILSCTNQHAMLYSVLAARISKRKCKVVEVFHSTLPTGFKDRLQGLIYNFFFRLCDHVVFVCFNQQSYWLHNRKLKVRGNSVIHNGIETRYFANYLLTENDQNALARQYSLGKYDLLIGICAALRPEKRHIDLIKAVSLVRQRGADVKLFIIGDGPERHRIETFIKSDDDTVSAVRVTGFQSDVRPYVFLCDCLVISSIATETFSIAALEAMAMGKPMIMSDIGGASEQINHGLNGFLYPKGNVEALAETIERMANNEERKKMGQAAKATVCNNFTLEKMTRKFEYLFEELLERPLVA